MQFLFDTASPFDPTLPAAWILTRDARNELLSHYLGIPAPAVTIGRGAFGRPTVAGANIDFSASHSNGFTAIAITPAGRIGVDIATSAPHDWQAVAQQFCTPSELAWMKSEHDFLLLWTAKEACTKALGLGTNTDLRGIELCRPAASAGYPSSPTNLVTSSTAADGPTEDAPLQILRIQHSTTLARGWQLFQRKHEGLVISVALAQ